MECALSGCTRPSRKRGLCNACYQRLRRRGDPLPPRVADFWGRVQKSETEGPCWIWRGPRTRQGYGIADGTGAHRRSYEELVGPIPDGLVLDHLCVNPPCVNPAHLEAVTAVENTRRGAVRRSTCGNGHPWTPENTYSYKTGKYIQRQCRTCARAVKRAYKLRQKEMA